MRLAEIPTGEWFHDPDLHVEGVVEYQGPYSTVVRLHRPRKIIINGEVKAVIRFEKPSPRTGEWDVEPGRLQANCLVRETCSMDWEG